MKKWKQFPLLKEVATALTFLAIRRSEKLLEAEYPE